MLLEFVLCKLEHHRLQKYYHISSVHFHLLFHYDENNVTDYFTFTTFLSVAFSLRDPGTRIPYNGIFLRRQIFAVLSQKHGDYFSRILIFAVGNVRENNFNSFPRKSYRGGGITQLSLDRSTVRKENLWPKYLKRKGIKDTCSLADTKKTNKKNIFTYRRLNKITVQSKTMKCLSYT